MITQELCRRCDKPMVKIVYGYPTPDLLDLQNQGLIKLAGCYHQKIGDYVPPTHFCNSCLFAYPD